MCAKVMARAVMYDKRILLCTAFPLKYDCPILSCHSQSKCFRDDVGDGIDRFVPESYVEPAIAESFVTQCKLRRVGPVQIFHHGAKIPVRKTKHPGFVRENVLTRRF